ncbi:MAG: hypothetical protein VX223_18685 [Myxococcota bacterium]|nr:hypothetical protein [Myxococcota bacterium]
MRDFLSRWRLVARRTGLLFCAGCLLCCLMILGSNHVLATAPNAVSEHIVAGGVRLHNRDTKTYRLYVRHASSAVHTSIGPKTITNICSGECSIELKDSGTSIQATPGETVLIEGGRLARNQ